MGKPRVYKAFTNHIFNYQLSTMTWVLSGFLIALVVYMCLLDFFYVFFGLAWVRGGIVMNPSAV